LGTLLQSKIGCLIQAYWSISSANWDTIINIRNQHLDTPMAVVLSIAGGGAGTSTQSAWTDLIGRLQGSAIIVLGRVDTQGGASGGVVSESTVNSRTTDWKNFYPTIDGVFFDNMGIQTTDQTFYTNVANHAKVNQGFQTVGGNCRVAATVVETTWHSQTVPIDTFIVFDGEGLDPVDTSYSKYSALNNNQLAVSAFGVPALDNSWVQQMSAYVGWIYCTTGTGSTPYNSLPSYFNNLITLLESIGAGGSTGSSFDQWGIRKIYHTKAGGEEFFTNQSNILADAAPTGRIQNYEGENIVAQSDGSHQSNGGSNGDLRLEIWSPAYSDINQRTAACWLNVECTIYFKYISQDGRDPSYACQLYMKGGDHSSSRPCDGAAYKFRVSRTLNETSYDKEICHASYAGNTNRTTVPGLSGGFGNGQWHGFKGVQWTEGSTVRLETYIDLNCSDANGNLVIRNNWVRVNQRTDSGGWAADSRYSTDCSGCGRSSSSEVMTGPYYITSSSSGNYRRNLCAYRTDGVTSRFRYYSAREIDPTRPATGEEPPPDPGSDIDQFGIKKIYPTITNGYEWFMDMTGATPNTNTARFRMDSTPGTISKNVDGSFKYSGSDAPDMFIYQRNGYNATLTASNATDHSLVHSRGYMQDVTDWRNVEATAYVRLNNNPTPGSGSFQWLTRGGRHLTPVPNCEGSALRGYVFDNGETGCSKEQWHVAQVNANRGVGMGDILGKWIGIKFVVVTKTLSGTLVTNQQIWLDPLNTNTWTKYDERTDAGGWGTQGGTCNGAPDQLIAWGGPIVQFDWLGFNDVDFKNFSCREIDPNATPIAAPPGSNTSLCGEE
jgi:hypothetical protein